jgi:ABC-type Fe3+/spermidine/putrescine transport system ATPase subunit
MFAAAFFGESSFLDVVVDTAGALAATIDSECGRLRCSGNVPANLKKGAEVTVLVRPENLALTADPSTGAAVANTNVFSGIVQAHLILGSTVKHRVRLGNGKELSVQQANHPGTRVFRKDEEVRISFEDASAVVLDSRRADRK